MTLYERCKIFSQNLAFITNYRQIASAIFEKPNTIVHLVIAFVSSHIVVNQNYLFTSYVSETACAVLLINGHREVFV